MNEWVSELPQGYEKASETLNSKLPMSRSTGLQRKAQKLLARGVMEGISATWSQMQSESGKGAVSKATMLLRTPRGKEK